ncbi:MAG TPA: transcription termination factor Rho [Candidatus Polarisedimenticolaceae bacterium]|nr:transcription termination factor Rho [Candidatus Polarisedimenticolaceae bacterium]
MSAQKEGRRRSRNRSRGGRRRGGRGTGGHHHQRQPGGNWVATISRAPQVEPSVEVVGVLQIVEAGHGFLRSTERDLNADPSDPVVPVEIIREQGLATGLELSGLAAPAEQHGRAPWLLRIGSINGEPPEQFGTQTPFKDLVAEDPTERIRLETVGEELSTRVVDLISPIGKGQRCLVVAPPKAGKTVLLQKIAHAISVNHPEIHLIVLLVDERPEEVTDMRRNVRGEVIASSSDEMARTHVQIAEIVLERAKRLVEYGRDVVVLLDSITRLSRAYNAEQRNSGRVLSGGIDARTMEKPRRFFGAARKAHGGGSLTVIGTALVDTGSRMDEVIFQEFKGTGNTEVVMDRRLFERRIFPSIDISSSGTRKEEKLFSPTEYKMVTLLRRALAPLKPAEAMQVLTERLAKHRSNAEFLERMQS